MVMTVYASLMLADMKWKIPNSLMKTSPNVKKKIFVGHKSHQTGCNMNCHLAWSKSVCIKVAPLKIQTRDFVIMIYNGIKHLSDFLLLLWYRALIHFHNWTNFFSVLSKKDLSHLLKCCQDLARVLNELGPKQKHFWNAPGKRFLEQLRKLKKNQSSRAPKKFKNATFWPFSLSWGNWPMHICWLSLSNFFERCEAIPTELLESVSAASSMWSTGGEL